MVTPTLATAGAVSLLVGVAFMVVARAVARRSATPANLLARRAHATWWGGLGAYLVLQGALTLAASFDALDTRAYLASRLLAIPLLCVSTWGITAYLSHLYTGDRRYALALAAFYALVGVLFFAATFAVPQRLVTERWIVTLDDEGPLYRLVYALVGLPVILSSVAYLALLRRTRDPEQRYRIALVGGGILLYVGAGLAARLAAGDAVIFVTLVGFGLAAAAASVLAYHPPAYVRRRLAPGGR